MSDSARFSVLNPEGRLVLSFPFGTSWETMLDTLDTYATQDQEEPS